MNNNFQTPQEALKVLFGYDAFRPGQESVIDSILSGKDVCAIMPTGVGMLSDTGYTASGDHAGYFTFDLPDAGSGQGFE